MASEESPTSANQIPRVRRARTDVARTMILAAVLSVLLIGAFNFYQSRNFLLNEVEGQLQDVAASRTSRLERGIANLTQLTESIAASPSTTEALLSLSDGFAAIDEGLNASQAADLEAFYADTIVGTQLPGGAAISDDVFPASNPAQYLQYWYIAQNPFEDRSELVDPDDGSLYSEAHAQYHPEIRRLAGSGVIGDVVLVDRNGDIVYTTDKRIDLGANIVTGPHAGEEISGIIDDLQASPAGQAALVDFSPYGPAGGEIEMWVVTLVRSGDEVIGALAVSIPSQVITKVVTENGMWEETGLGETGEVYVVGRDGTLRTESRQFLEDPAAYIAALESAGGAQVGVAEAVSDFGTTVLVQLANTEPVAVAQQGDRFSGSSSNYLDQSTESISGPVGPNSLGWVLVTEAQQSEISAPLYDYLLSLGIVTLIVIVVAVAIAIYASLRLLRPIDPIVDAAQRVSEGDLGVRLPDEGRDEFAFLSSEFNDFVDELVRRGEEVAATEAETTELLASVVPRRLVDKVMAGDRDIAEAMSNASIVAIMLTGTIDNARSLEDLAENNAVLVSGMASIAERYGAEQLSSSAVAFLYATGLNVEAPRIEDAVAFAIAAAEWLSDTLASHGFLLAAAVGVASGDVVTGVMGTERLTVDVLGAPRHVAGSLSQAASPRQVLVGAEIAGTLGEAWQVDRIAGLEDLSGSPLEAWQVASRTSV